MSTCGVWTAREAYSVDQNLRLAPHPRLVDRAELRAWHVADKEILEDRQIAEQVRVLVHDGNAVALRIEG